MKKIRNKQIRRALRVAAFALGAGIAFMGAGNVLGIGAVTSAIFGATGAVLGLVGALSFTYALKDEVPDADFDATISSAIEQVESKAAKK